MKIYLIHIFAAGIIGAIVKSFFNDSKTIKYAVELITGVFILLSLLSIFGHNSTLPQRFLFNSASETCAAIIQSGKAAAEKERKSIIKKESEAYICNKAEIFGAEIKAEVKLSEEEPYYPIFTIITGNISPFVRRNLSHDIEAQLGISKENQKWIS